MFRGSQIIEEDLQDRAAGPQARLCAAGIATGFVKFGAKLVDREKASDQDMPRSSMGSTAICCCRTFPPRRPRLLRERAPATRFGPQVDFGAAQHFYDANAAGSN